MYIQLHCVNYSTPANSLVIHMTQYLTLIPTSTIVSVGKMKQLIDYQTTTPREVFLFLLDAR